MSEENQIVTQEERDKALKDLMAFVHDQKNNPFLARYVIKMMRKHSSTHEYSEDIKIEKYYNFIFKKDKDTEEMLMRPGLMDAFLQYQICTNLLEATDKEESQFIAGMMQHDGTFSILYTDLVKTFQKTQKWDDEKFELIWDDALKRLT